MWENVISNAKENLIQGKQPVKVCVFRKSEKEQIYMYGSRVLLLNESAYSSTCDIDILLR